MNLCLSSGTLEFHGEQCAKYQPPSAGPGEGNSCVAPFLQSLTSTSITSCIFSVNTVTHSKTPSRSRMALELGPGSVRCRSPRSEPQNQWNPQPPASSGILRHPTASCSCSSWKMRQMPESSFFPANDHPVILLVLLSLKPRLPAESPLSPTDRPG